MYGWEPGKRGAHSSSLEYHVQKAIEGGMVETLPAHAPGGKDSAMYALSCEGKKKFQELLGAFGDDVVAIRGLLQSQGGTSGGSAVPAGAGRQSRCWAGAAGRPWPSPRDWSLSIRA